MAFTFSQARRITPEESSPYNNLVANAMKNYQQNIAARYAPETARANIFNKMVSPLAQIAISPLGMAMAPEQQQQLQQYISQALNNMSQGSGQQNHEGGLMNSIRGLFGGNQEEQTSNNQQMTQETNYPAQQGNNSYSLLPQAGQGNQAGARVNALAPFHSSPVKPGTVYQNPNTGEVLSSPTPENISNAQQIITNIKSVTPIIKTLSKQAAPFLKKGGQLGLTTSKIAGELAKWGVPNEVTSLIGSQDLANKHAQFEATQAITADRLMGALNLPPNLESLQTIKKIISPQPGENDKGYENRMARELVALSKREKQATTTLGGGFSLSNNSPSNNFDLYESAKQLGIPADDITNDAKHFKTTEDIIVNGLRAGIKTEKEMRDYIKEQGNG